MATTRPAFTLRLSASLRDKVLRSGYRTVADLSSVPILELSSELALSPEQSRELQQQLHPESLELVTFLANQTWEQEKKWMHITTSSAALDKLFAAGQGIPPGKITEICGLSGTGKTQLGLQLCINAQIPRSADAAGGTAIFIDTEGSFVAKRVVQIATARCNRVRDRSENMAPVSVNSFLQGIQYCRVHSPVELIAMIRVLSGIAQEHTRESNWPRWRANMVSLYVTHDTILYLEGSVVVMNQMTTKMETNSYQRTTFPSNNDRSSGSSGQVQPALGETWASMCTHRIRLQHHADGQRSATLFKSPSPFLPEQIVTFRIDQAGISDVANPADVAILNNRVPPGMGIGLAGLDLGTDTNDGDDLLVF
ncbi:hypothetical protein BG011_009681 [Mortierella polycephala]|uniref:DNA repair protein RAD51 homolog 3 n=1 Tax=Mortierella polycephala TaxID=41804 RepID=A0A9P6PMN2_9FUNG|nr:hypothetical protein BG011_009681 [Mortierella polycephala]